MKKVSLMLLGATIGCLPASARSEARVERAGEAEFASLLGTPAEWAANGFGDPVFYKLKTPLSRGGSQFKLRARMVFVKIRGSDWKLDDVQEQFDLIAKIYSQCGLFFDDSPVVEADSPLGHSSIDPGVGDHTELAKHLPSVAHPLMFLDGPHLSMADGFSFGEGNYASGTFPSVKRLNVAFVSEKVIPRNSIIHLSGLVITAHELAHILFDENHNQLPETNILTDDLDADPPRWSNSHITAEQCAKLNHAPGVKPL